MKLKIISWNVRGLNDIEKRVKIRRMLREWKANIVCLQETKMEVGRWYEVCGDVSMLIGCTWDQGGQQEVFC